jgi:hypothetical protein
MSAAELSKPTDESAGYVGFARGVKPGVLQSRLGVLLAPGYITGSAIAGIVIAARKLVAPLAISANQLRIGNGARPFFNRRNRRSYQADSFRRSWHSALSYRARCPYGHASKKR